VSSPAVLSPPRRLQIGLHESSRGCVTYWDSEKAESHGRLPLDEGSCGAGAGHPRRTRATIGNMESRVVLARGRL
jgi:hypothetical protein